MNIPKLLVLIWCAWSFAFCAGLIQAGTGGILEAICAGGSILIGCEVLRSLEGREE